MELQDKKDNVIRCIMLGTDLYTAFLSSACTDEEIELLEADPFFMAEVEARKAVLEVTLLEDHQRARELAAEKNGNTHGLEWILERVNKERWGKSMKIDKPKRSSNVNVYIPDNGRGID